MPDESSPVAGQGAAPEARLATAAAENSKPNGAADGLRCNGCGGPFIESRYVCKMCNGQFSLCVQCFVAGDPQHNRVHLSSMRKVSVPSSNGAEAKPDPVVPKKKRSLSPAPSESENITSSVLDDPALAEASRGAQSKGFVAGSGNETSDSEHETQDVGDELDTDIEEEHVASQPDPNSLEPIKPSFQDQRTTFHAMDRMYATLHEYNLGVLDRSMSTNVAVTFNELFHAGKKIISKLSGSSETHKMVAKLIAVQVLRILNITDSEVRSPSPLQADKITWERIRLSLLASVSILCKQYRRQFLTSAERRLVPGAHEPIAADIDQVKTYLRQLKGAHDRPEKLFNNVYARIRRIFKKHMDTNAPSHIATVESKRIADQTLSSVATFFRLEIKEKSETSLATPKGTGAPRETLPEPRATPRDRDTPRATAPLPRISQSTAMPPSKKLRTATNSPSVSSASAKASEDSKSLSKMTRDELVQEVMRLQKRVETAESRVNAFMDKAHRRFLYLASAAKNE